MSSPLSTLIVLLAACVSVSAQAYFPNSEFTGFAHRDRNFVQDVHERAPHLDPWSSKLYSMSKLYTLSPYLSWQLLEENDWQNFEEAKDALHKLSSNYYKHFHNEVQWDDEHRKMAATHALTDHFHGDEHECAKFIHRCRGRNQFMRFDRDEPVWHNSDIHEAQHQLHLMQLNLPDPSPVREFPLCPTWDPAAPLCDPHKFNGVHTWVANTWSGMDFWSTNVEPLSSWTGKSTESEFVFASWGGTVDIIDTCGFVEVDHGVLFTIFNFTITWQTRYLHLESDLGVTDGQVIANSQHRIGTVADTQAEATCVPGTFSTGPHVHMDLLLNGQYANLKGWVFSGYTIDYPDDVVPYSTTTSLTKDGSTVWSYSGFITTDHCFHKDTLVTLKSGTSVKMSELTHCDEVMVVNGNGELSYEAVYAFATQKLDRASTFVEISFDGGDTAAPLKMTPNHFVFTAEGVAVEAHYLKIGQAVRTASGVATVSSVRLLQEAGVVAPLTLSGTIVANNVVCSTYANLGGLLSTHEAVHTMVSWPTTLMTSVLPETVTQLIVSAGFATYQGIAASTTVINSMIDAGALSM